MAEENKLSTTVRIDLLPNPASPAKIGRTPKPISSVTRMDWKQPGRTPDYVARSRYQELLQSLYDATLVTKLDGSIIDTNTRASKFLQHEKTALMSMSISDMISGADEALIQKVRENLERERFTVIQAFCVRKDESFFPAEIAVSRIRLDEPCLCFFIRDTTIRVEAEARVLLEHQALQLSASGAIIADVDANVIYANNAFSLLVGNDDEATLMGRDLRELVTQPEGLSGLVAAALETEGAVEMDLVIARGDVQQPVRFTAAANWSPDGEPLGIAFSVEAL